MPQSFQLARALMSSTLCIASIRYVGSLAILANMVRKFGATTETDLLKKLILLSPVRTIDDISEHLLESQLALMRTGMSDRNGLR